MTTDNAFEKLSFLCVLHFLLDFYYIRTVPGKHEDLSSNPWNIYRNQWLYNLSTGSRERKVEAEPGC